MADLNAYKEVTQLSEDMEYPEGYNVVEITGTGDERTARVFPTITITGPTGISSDGKTVAKLTVRITDTNSSNPFYLEPDQVEEVTPSGPQDIETQYHIKTLKGVYLDAGMTQEIPMQYLSHSENMIHIADGWTEPGAPANWIGLYHIQAWVKYDGQHTVSIEDGLQTVDRWWSRAGDDESETESDVSGKMYFDAAGVEEVTSGEIPIPNLEGQSTTVYFYYRPDAGESGIAYLNAEWGDSTDMWQINVTMGSYSGSSISLSPEPSTIAPGATSVVTATVTNANGGPVTTGSVKFYIQSGKGSYSPASASLSTYTGQEDEVMSSSKTEFSLPNPPVKISAISIIGNTEGFAGGGGWNGQITISGTTCTFKSQELTADQVPMLVTYDWGGKCSTTYTATGAGDGDKIYFGGTLGGGVNNICTIEIDEDAGDDGGDGDASLDINAESPIDRGGESAVTCIATNSDGEYVTSGISYTLTPRRGTLSMKGDNTTITDEEGSISSMTEVSVNYPVASVSKVEYNSQTYAVRSFDGTTITIATSFGVTTGTALVTYTTAGVSRGTYHAEDDNYEVTITAMYDGAEPDSCIIQVGDGEDGGSFTTAADPGTIKAGEKSTIKGTVIEGGNPAPNKTVTFDKVSGPGTLSANSDLTDAEGVASVSLTTTKAGGKGTAKINVTYGGDTQTVDVTVDISDDEKGDQEDTMELPPIVITGWVDPAKKEYQLTGGATVTDWGIADSCDEFGGYDGDPANAGYDGYVKIYSNDNDAFAWDIVSVAVSGGTFAPDAMEQMDPFFLDSLEIGVPWTFVANTARNQTLQVTDQRDSTIPIVGATVTIGGQTVSTDGNGVATFSGLSPGTYQISITHPNYKDNRSGAVGGTGIFDDDTTNDEYIVSNYSEAPWLLQKMDINISITYTVYKRWIYTT